MKQWFLLKSVFLWAVPATAMQRFIIFVTTSIKIKFVLGICKKNDPLLTTN